MTITADLHRFETAKVHTAMNREPKNRNIQEGTKRIEAKFIWQGKLKELLRINKTR